MPLYLAFREGWLDLAYGISGVWALGQNFGFIFTINFLNCNQDKVNVYYDKYDSPLLPVLQLSSNATSSVKATWIGDSMPSSESYFSKSFLICDPGFSLPSICSVSIKQGQLFFLFLAVLGFELRVLCLLGKRSITRAIPPEWLSFFFLHYKNVDIFGFVAVLCALPLEPHLQPLY
jgi:hypothetical protein